MEGAGRGGSAQDLEPEQNKEDVCLARLLNTEGWTHSTVEGHSHKGVACHGMSKSEWVLEGVCL